MKRKGLSLFSVIIALALAAGLVYFLYPKSAQRMEQSPPGPQVSISSKEGTPRAPERYPILSKETQPPSGPTRERPPEGPSGQVRKDPCGRMDKDMADLFQYLDQKRYVQHLTEGKSTREIFSDTVKRLNSKRPVPAGEGIDPTLVIRNMYHFYRALPLKELRLVQEILLNEPDSLELNLELLYAWAVSKRQCPDPQDLRPPDDALYDYAGLLLNSTGGRAYLARRSPHERLLVTYYCISILHEADRQGKNSYGINVSAYVSPLREEMLRYPDLHYQRDYLNRLKQMEKYYLEKRQ